MPTNSLPENIFGQYDIRGVVGKDLTEERMATLGRGIGTFLTYNECYEVLLGRDNRPSGEAFEETLTKALAGTGCNVTKLGIITTPMLHFAAEGRRVGAVMITASHNKPEYNGLKISLGGKPLGELQYQTIRKIAQKDIYPAQKPGTESKAKIEEEYIKFIKDNVRIEKPLKLVIDCGNGTAGPFAQKILESKSSEIISLYADSDGTFPNHLPYPQDTKLYGKLVETIKDEGADFGLAFDGDGDRLGVYSDKGDFIQSDQIAALFAVEILKEHPGGVIVLNSAASQSSIEKIKEAGGRVVFAETGYPGMAKTIKETKSPLGAEISGHFFFSDRYFGYDDAIYAAARFLEMMSRGQKKLSELVGEFPRYQTTDEFRIEIPKSLDKTGVVKSLRKTLSEQKPQITFLDIDGLRFTFPDNSWGLVRFSHTEPVISVRAEGKTKDSLEKVKEIIQRNLADFDIPLDWEKSAIS